MASAPPTAAVPVARGGRAAPDELLAHVEASRDAAVPPLRDRAGARRLRPAGAPVRCGEPPRGGAADVRPEPSARLHRPHDSRRGDRQRLAPGRRLAPRPGRGYTPVRIGVPGHAVPGVATDLPQAVKSVESRHPPGLAGIGRRPPTAWNPAQPTRTRSAPRTPASRSPTSWGLARPLRSPKP